MTPLHLYLPLGRDAEIEVSLRVREYDGIESDPGVRVREVTGRELLEALARLGAADAREVFDRLPGEMRARAFTITGIEDFDVLLLPGLGRPARRPDDAPH